MILYLDTSALVKLLHSEEGSAALRAAADQASALATSTLTRLEVHSTLARLGREGAPREHLVSWFEAFATAEVRLGEAARQEGLPRVG